jgi:hypothetical protein
MKFSLTLGSPGPLTREQAWTCLRANMGFSGSGSVMAGKWVGYLQALLALAVISLSLIYGTRFAIWFFANWSRLQATSADPLQTLHDVWLGVRWALLGMALFALAWLWGLLSDLLLMAAGKKTPMT